MDNYTWTCQCWPTTKHLRDTFNKFPDFFVQAFKIDVDSWKISMLLLYIDHLAWIEHQFLSGIRDSRKARSLWGMMRAVGGVRKSIHHSWLAKGLGLGLGLLCCGFKGVQEEIPSEEASTLQIVPMAFWPGQHTSPQLYPCHRLFEQDGHQNSSSDSL